MLSVTYFYRQPRANGVSIEGIFRQVKQCLTGKVDIKEFYCDPGASRSQQIKSAGKAAGALNHITGDVNFLILGMKDKKNILTIHDFGSYEVFRSKKNLKFILFHFIWFKWPLRHTRVVTVVSEFTKAKLIRYFNFPENRIHVIPNPVKSVFRYAHKEQCGSQPRILILGTGKHKNLDCLIEASRGTNFHIDIVGWPAADELGKLKAYCISHSIYNGLTDEEVFERYKECDILYIASHNEGFGMPIIEAQAIGRPVITSNFGAMKEVAKESAILVDPTKPEQVNSAIISLAGDKEVYNKYVRLGLQNVQPYDHRQISEQYYNIYKMLAEGKA